MPGAQGLERLVEGRLTSELAELGFSRRGSTFVLHHHDVAWLLAPERTPWSTPGRIVFSMVWAVQVPGLRAVLGEHAPPGPPVLGWVGQAGAALQPRWFRLGATTVLGLGSLRLARAAGEVRQHVEEDALPRLRELPDAGAVQQHLVADLDRRGTAPSPGEVAAIRRVAAISVLRGRHDNALRWLDYLEARSSRVTPPDLVAERLAPFRERCLAS